MGVYTPEELERIKYIARTVFPNAEEIEVYESGRLNFAIHIEGIDEINMDTLMRLAEKIRRTDLGGVYVLKGGECIPLDFEVYVNYRERTLGVRIWF